MTFLASGMLNSTTDVEQVATGQLMKSTGHQASRRLNQRGSTNEPTPCMIRIGSMPRYYFHVYDDVDLRDNVGTDCTDLKAAKMTALAMVGRLLSEGDDTIWNGNQRSIDVEDESGRIAYSLKFTADHQPV